MTSQRPSAGVGMGSLVFSWELSLGIPGALGDVLIISTAGQIFVDKQ